MTQSSSEDRRPRESQITAEPAIVDQCQKDYRHGIAARSTAYRQMHRAGATNPS
ncbi:hypothetical protein [Streptomyces sp. NPDC002215]|uniref:hypothetical protein n=1 Tax=Streptomyces sp. NPDC002215 TaxID=3154412 RepID=UPI00331A8B73